MHSLAAESCDPWWFACGAQSNSDCVVTMQGQPGILRPAAVPKRGKKTVQEQQLLLPSFGGVWLTGLFVLVTTFCKGRMVAIVQVDDQIH